MADLSELNRCRLCFSQNNLTDAVFPAAGAPNDELMSMIYACTSVRICFEKDFPCPVCSSCVRIVNQFYAFRRKCQSNDRELKQQRGEKLDEEDDGEADDGDPLSANVGGRPVKQEARDEGFYAQMREQINCFLQQEVKVIERKALAKVKEALKSRVGEEFAATNTRQMTVEVEVLGGQNPSYQDHEESMGGNNDFPGFDDSQHSDDNGYENYGHNSTSDSTDWKNKYLTLQKNNELLQKAFREQKEKTKTTEQQLKTLRRLGSKANYQDEASASGASGLGFKEHPAFPEITVEFLKQLNFNSGPGEKGDRSFISKLAVAVFGVDTMVNSSISGRQSNAHLNLPSKPPLCPQKIAGIGLKLFERVQLEVGPGEQEELLARASEKLVRQVLVQKVTNLRKQVLTSKGDNEGADSAPPAKKRSRH